jgi:hypothetical protein
MKSISDLSTLDTFLSSRMSDQELKMVVNLVVFLRSLPYQWNATKAASLKRTADSMTRECITSVPLGTVIPGIEERGLHCNRSFIKRYKSYVENPTETINPGFEEERQLVIEDQKKNGIRPFAQLLSEPEKVKERVVAFHQQFDSTGITQLMLHLRKYIVSNVMDYLQVAAVTHPDLPFQRSCQSAVQWLLYLEHFPGKMPAPVIKSETIGQHTFSFENCFYTRALTEHELSQLKLQGLFGMTFYVKDRMTFHLFAPGDKVRKEEGPLAVSLLPEETTKWLVVAYCDFICFWFTFE